MFKFPPDPIFDSTSSLDVETSDLDKGDSDSDSGSEDGYWTADEGDDEGMGAGDRLRQVNKKDPLLFRILLALAKS
jgi:hypothetical protein